MKKWDPHLFFYRNIAEQRDKLINFSPPAVLSLGFLILICLGTLLLKLPIASHTETGWQQALFTATSAVTVTGLVVLDTGAHFTLFGQIVIALLIQTGGLGFITFAVVAAMSLGTKIGIGQQLVAMEAFNQTSLKKTLQIAKYVLFYSLGFELLGILLLTPLWLETAGFSQALHEAAFHSISAFNNAGFSLYSNNLMQYSDDIQVNLIITALLIIGGIGFAVLLDLRQHKKWSKLSANTKMVLLATLLLNVISFLLIWALETNNPNTLGSLPLSQQAIAAWFQAVTPRTAGFNTLAIEQLTDASTLLMIMLMFIGGGSLSTAGGIKVGTFVVLIMATYSFLNRSDEVIFMRRTIPAKQVMKALALTIISMILIFLGTFILTVTEQAEFIDIVFEVVSALSTVGLSRGLTNELSSSGELVVIFLMIVGRLGPLTLAYILATPYLKNVRYANADIQVG
ncbi:MAG: TrkH family potassium uptake protein [Methylococcaceae bacterium]|nr:TrkH family potassium uptake protein [Methylococcaceae bacterium]